MTYRRLGSVSSGGGSSLSSPSSSTPSSWSPSSTCSTCTIPAHRRRACALAAVALALALLADGAGGAATRRHLHQHGHIHQQHAPQTHHLTKRSFFDLQCRGVYDKSIFARLDRICEDCYNLFREPSIHSLCRQNCFTTNIFKGCVDTLQLSDETDQIQAMIKQLHGADPGV